MALAKRIATLGTRMLVFGLVALTETSFYEKQVFILLQ